MEVTPKIQEQLDQLHEKFEAINQNTSTHLEGLLWAKPITYSRITCLQAPHGVIGSARNP